MGFLISIIIGGLAGWAAGELFKGDGFGIIKNIALGIVGGLIGEFLLKLVGIQSESIIFQFAAAMGGALLILFVVKKIKS